MRRRSRAGSTKPRRRMAPAAKRRRRVETIRGVTSSASKEEDGTVKHVDADILPVFSATGEFAEIIATAVDVTEQVRRGSIVPLRSLACATTERKPQRNLGPERDINASTAL